MAQSQPLGFYTFEQVREIARRAERQPASLTLAEVRMPCLLSLLP